MKEEKLHPCQLTAVKNAMFLSTMGLLSRSVIVAVLATVLLVGSKASICEVISMAGIKMHHHVGGSAPSVCLESHDKGEEKPCGEDCEIDVSEMVVTVSIKVPLPMDHFIGELFWQPSAEQWSALPTGAISYREPPDQLSGYDLPVFSGRFLI